MTAPIEIEGKMVNALAFATNKMKPLALGRSPSLPTATERRLALQALSVLDRIVVQLMTDQRVEVTVKRD